MVRIHAFQESLLGFEKGEIGMDSNALIEAAYAGGAQRGRLIRLDTPLGDDALLPLYAKGTSRLGRDYEFIVDVISVKRDPIDLQALIRQPVTLWLRQLDHSYLPHHGYVTSAARLGGDGALSFYQLRFSSWMCFLPLRRDMRDWQEQPGEQIVGDVFDEHPQARGAYRFDLHEPMPRYSYRVQWEDDWSFVHRNLEEAGVFGRFEQAPDGRSHQLVLMDDLYFAPELAQATACFCRTGLREEVDGFSQWKELQQIRSARLATRTFDFKRPDLRKEINSAISWQEDTPAQGEVYDYTGAYTWDVRERGEHQNAMRIEAWESQMKRFHGIGNLRCAMPGYRFTLEGHPVHDKAPKENREFAILATTWTIRNNLPGMDGIAAFSESLRAEIAAVANANAGGARVRHSDGSEGFFQVEIEAQRRRQPFRSAFDHRKPVMQLQTAIVAGPENEEIYTDALNRVKVWFPWNRRNEGDERASLWVRAAFPDAGRQRGGHFPLRKGDEVLVGFAGGDCDRPVILGRMHGGPTPPVWHTNGLLSGYRSKEYGGDGFNQLLLDDATGQNRIHLYSTSADSHLHLGYLIDHRGNARGEYLGAGFDLKTNAYGAVRAERGLYLSTYSAAAKQPMDVREASNQLVNAENLFEALSDSSRTHHAESLNDGYDSLKALTDATRAKVAGDVSGGGRTAGGGAGNVNGFGQPIMLMASPAGIALSTQKSTQIAADQHVNVVSGRNTHVAAGRSLIASVAHKISLFAQNAGIKMFAAKGKIDVQAHSDGIELHAQKAVKIVSATDAIEIASEREILLTSGGAYIRIKGGNIDIHAPGSVDVKGSKRRFSGPARVDYRLSALPTSKYNAALQYLYHDDEPIQGAAYRVTLADGRVREGALDAAGRMTLADAPVGAVKVELGPDTRAYRRKDGTGNPDFREARPAESDIDSLLAKHGSAFR
jgi:type VI secretion system secreted protein VgrG